MKLLFWINLLIFSTVSGFAADSIASVGEASAWFHCDIRPDSSPSGIPQIPVNTKLIKLGFRPTDSKTAEFTALLSGRKDGRGGNGTIVIYKERRDEKGNLVLDSIVGDGTIGFIVSSDQTKVQIQSYVDNSDPRLLSYNGIVKIGQWNQYDGSRITLAYHDSDGVIQTANLEVSCYFD